MYQFVQVTLVKSLSIVRVVTTCLVDAKYGFCVQVPIYLHLPDLLIDFDGNGHRTRRLTHAQYVRCMKCRMWELVDNFIPMVQAFG